MVYGDETYLDLELRSREILDDELGCFENLRFCPSLRCYDADLHCIDHLLCNTDDLLSCSLLAAIDGVQTGKNGCDFCSLLRSISQLCLYSSHSNDPTIAVLPASGI